MIVFCKAAFSRSSPEIFVRGFPLPGRPDLRGRRRDIPHSDANVQARRQRAAANLADACSVVEERIVRARRRTLPVHLECDEPFARTVGFGLKQFFASGEIWFLQIDEKSESGLDRIA